MRLTGKGFSLFELMIVVAILSIMVVMAYPSYVESVRKGRRADAQAQMREFESMAARQYTVSTSYAACAVDGGACTAPADTDYYTFTAVANAATWSISAAPQGGQASDPCGTMTLDSAGRMTGAKAGCWGGKGTS